MKVSIVTTSFNQANWIGKNLASLSNQTYEDFEHIVIDPGSSDNSRDIIDYYAEKDSRIRRVYEPDRGQVDAINKGLALSSGELLTWLNSDDYYHNDNAIKSIIDFHKKTNANVIYGRGWRVDPTGKKLSEAYTHPDHTDMRKSLEHSIGILQPSLFFTRGVFDHLGGLDETYNLQLDYEYWIRMAQAGYEFRKVDALISNATVHADAKSTGQRLAQLNECFYLVLHKFGYVHDDWVKRYAEFFLTKQDRKVDKNIEKDTPLKKIEKALVEQLKNYLHEKHGNE